MLESIIPATTVIDKPEIGVTSTESSISCIEYDRDVEDEPQVHGAPAQPTPDIFTVQTV
jgi:hypothetical protein